MTSRPPAAAVPSGAASPIRVLIADDEAQLREALSELLSHEERIDLIGTAADADAAAAIANRERPDVALVDVKMPGGGGPRAAREIARVSPDTRVIALSAFEDRATVLEMLRAGAVGYLVKGSPAEDLISSIERVVDGGASLSPEVVGGIVFELGQQLRRDEMEQEERDALRKEINRFLAGDGLTMVFQPIVDLTTRESVGYEALARFRSLQPRPPNEWFADAVALELGSRLELAAISEALRSIPQLPDGVYLGVNCSHRVALSQELSDIVAEHADRIVIEITEHEAVDDYDELEAALAELRAAGVRVAIDDAGAGFASLRHALRIAPDIVKLDVSLVRGIDEDRAKRALATAIISFAAEMGMSLVAEGIETEQELETLRSLGVQLGQGFYLARPGPLT
jgi:EAL domain-containing protein (putative c-di-GMP-specific phosphodiesterase class I)/CheY-like chemotaxis protein